MHTLRNHLREQRLVNGEHELPTFLSVLDISPNKLGGIELFSAKLGRKLASLSWQSVFCFSGPPTPATAELFNVAGVQMEVLTSQAGLSLKSATDLRRLLKKHSPQVFMYAFNGILRLYPWTAKLAGCRKIIYNDHSSRPEGYISKPFRVPKQWFAKVLTAPVTEVISVSEYPRRMLLAQEVCSAPNRVIWNGVDLTRSSRVSRSDYLRRFGIPTDRLIVTQVSWLVPEKGIDILLHAAKLVISKIESVHFVFVGDGAGRSEYELLAASLGIASHVSFTGRINDPCTEGVYSSSDIACLISRWNEAFGLTLMEAMSFGIPVIASNRGSMPDLVEDGQSGYVVELKPEAVAFRILRLIEDRELRKSMGRAAKRKAHAGFDIDGMVEQYAELITQN